MRLSANPASPAYYCQVLADRGLEPHALVVSLNGARTDLVVEADSDEGWADTLVRSDDGSIAIDPNDDGRPAIVRVRGEVRFAADGASL